MDDAYSWGGGREADGPKAPGCTVPPHHEFNPPAFGLASPLQTSSRVITLREMYEAQAVKVKELSRSVNRVRARQEDGENRLESICDSAAIQQVRSAAA